MKPGLLVVVSSSVGFSVSGSFVVVGFVVVGLVVVGLCCCGRVVFNGNKKKTDEYIEKHNEQRYIQQELCFYD